ncbi:MAG: D-tyrosyl-tRNA(Tyr) deacylase [Gammaproteobacteria bacterium]|jgi:D-aminoacyl-tRNA deacylase
MIGLLQRVRHAHVEVQQNTIASIDAGLLVFIGIEKADDESKADRLLDRLLTYRVFSDHEGKMNLSLIDVKGGLLLVPQFTLAADTRHGMRPGFSGAATPLLARRLFDYMIEKAAAKHASLAWGQFGADMQVTLVNDGPVTFSLQV